MTPAILLIASLAAAPVSVQPEFHQIGQGPKQEQRLDKQLSRPSPVLFQTRMVRSADGRWVQTCDSAANDRLKSMPDFGVHLRRH
ncbi:MAG: hypothetical protein R3F15_07810 [Lysobacterales bacterium]